LGRQGIRITWIIRNTIGIVIQHVIDEIDSVRHRQLIDLIVCQHDGSVIVQEFTHGHLIEVLSLLHFWVPWLIYRIGFFFYVCVHVLELDPQQPIHVVGTLCVADPLINAGKKQSLLALFSFGILFVIRTTRTQYDAQNQHATSKES